MAGTIINYKRLNELMKDFRVLTNIRISFWDASGRMCVNSDEVSNSGFCAALREKDELEMACRKCDNESIKRARETGEPCHFTCHAGLREYTYPVVEAGKIIGFFMIGQVNMPEIYGDIIGEHRTKWHELGLDEKHLKKLFDELPVVTSEKMDAACHMLESLALYVYSTDLIRPAEFPLCYRIRTYIQEHLTTQMSLDSIATELNISRSCLCQTIRKEMNISVVQLILRLRCEKVIELLRCGRTLQDAATEAGFSSAGYCSRVFKKLYNETPVKYVKINEEMIES